MSPTENRARRGRVELAVALGAAVIIAFQLCFLVASLGFGVGRQLAGSGGVSCPEKMAVALTAQRDIACLSPGTELPRGWMMIAPAR